MHHAAGPSADGLVSGRRTAARTAHAPRAAPEAAPPRAGREGRLALARPLLALAFASLLAGIVGGLLRLGVLLPGIGANAWAGDAAIGHAALMICAFFGTTIGIERAVALKRRVAFAAPLASVLGGALQVLGHGPAAALCFVAAAAVFTGANVVIVRRQAAPHTALLLVAALAWLAGALLALGAAGNAAVLPLWFTFLVLTIAAERLEMTRLMRRRAGAQPLLLALVALLCGGALLAALAPAAGGLLYGVALVGLAAWLGLFDVARRTVRVGGLTRYMALCLLAGYAWLAMGGLAWIALALGHAAARDAALHALGLGFVFSMVMGHAPVILPAVARIKLAFGRWQYLPLLALHASLLLRLAGSAWDPRVRALGGALNGVAIVLFVLTIATSALVWRIGASKAPARGR
jgi:hypothetical protein